MLIESRKIRQTMPKQQRLVFCMKCGKCLGDYRPLYGKQHINDYPSHTEFFVIALVDPLLSKNPDDWFKRKGIHPEIIRKEFVTQLTKSDRIILSIQKFLNVTRRFLTKRKTDKDFTEPDISKIIEL